jgi:hypothetical protein
VKQSEVKQHNDTMTYILRNLTKESEIWSCEPFNTCSDRSLRRITPDAKMLHHILLTSGLEVPPIVIPKPFSLVTMLASAEAAECVQNKYLPLLTLQPFRFLKLNTLV